MIALELLNRQLLFKDLPLKILQEIQPFIRLQEFKRKEFVLHKGLAGDALLLLINGRLQVTSTSEAGKEVGINFLEPGDYFGEVSLIDGGPRSASVVAVSNSVVGFLAKSKAVWLFHHQPLVAARIQARLCSIVRNEIQFRSSLGGAKAYTRIYAVLCKTPHLKQAEAPIALGDIPNQNAIASMANVSRETVSRALTALVRAGVLLKNGRQWVVQNPQVLKRLASGELGLDNIPNPPNPSARRAVIFRLEQQQNRPASALEMPNGESGQPQVIRRTVIQQDD